MTGITTGIPLFAAFFSIQSQSTTLTMESPKIVTTLEELRGLSSDDHWEVSDEVTIVSAWTLINAAIQQSAADRAVYNIQSKQEIQRFKTRLRKRERETYTKHMADCVTANQIWESYMKSSCGTDLTFKEQLARSAYCNSLVKQLKEMTQTSQFHHASHFGNIPRIVYLKQLCLVWPPRHKLACLTCSQTGLFTRCRVIAAGKTSLELTKCEEHPSQLSDLEDLPLEPSFRLVDKSSIWESFWINSQ